MGTSVTQEAKTQPPKNHHLLLLAYRNPFLPLTTTYRYATQTLRRVSASDPFLPTRAGGAGVEPRRGSRGLELESRTKV